MFYLSLSFSNDATFTIILTASALNFVVLCHFFSAARVNERARKRIGLLITFLSASLQIIFLFYLCFFSSRSFYYLNNSSYYWLLSLSSTSSSLFYVRISKPNRLFSHMMLTMSFASRFFLLFFYVFCRQERKRQTTKIRDWLNNIIVHEEDKGCIWNRRERERNGIVACCFISMIKNKT